MAVYTFRLFDRTGKVIDTFDAELWQGNRNETNRQALAIGQNLLAFLFYKDIQSRIAVFSGLGNAGEQWAESWLDKQDWAHGAVTVDYLVAGRPKTACFTQDPKLGAKLIPGEDWFMTDPDKGSELVAPRIL